MKLTTTFLALALSAVTLQTSQAASILDFQTDSYTIEQPTTFPDYLAEANGLWVSGPDFSSQQVSVIFSAVDITEYTVFTLTGTLLSENYGTDFTMTFFDEDFNSRNYTGIFSYGTGRSTLILTAEDPFAPALSSIFGFTFTTSGAGEQFDYTFEKIEAIPEPSVYALSFLAAGGVYLLHRRRAVWNR